MIQYYVIKAAGGSLGDYWEDAIRVTNDLLKGEMYCAEKNAFALKVKTALLELNGFKLDWRAAYPPESFKGYEEWTLAYQYATATKLASFSKEIQHGFNMQEDTVTYSIEPIEFL